ncbi:MAG TPA: hypothetical protein DHV86_02650 [Methylophilaceae bacterium]|nr:hypothetical protein [Methylophilaceae bacterium]
MKNILVTGCAGFIGFHLSQLLLKSGYKVYGVDNLNDYYSTKLKSSRIQILEKDSKFIFYQNDIRDIQKIAFNERIDCVINLAAQAGVRLPRENFNKYLASNVDGFLSILDFCVDNNIDKVLYASSSSVYGETNSIPFSENEPINSPKSIYASSKIFNENLASVYSSEFNINLIGFRFFTVYGPWGRPDMAYFKFADSILKNEPIYLNNQGQMSRDMTHVSDIVRGILSGLEIIFLQKSDESDSYQNLIFNLGNDSPVQTLYLLETLESILGKKAKIIHAKTSNEVLSTHADLTKAFQYLAYKPKVSFDEGLKDFASWLLHYRDKT